MKNGKRITVTEHRGGFFTWIWTDEIQATVDSHTPHWPRRSVRACIRAALRISEKCNQAAARSTTIDL
jgi:hypothetical protein